jgi:peptidoglycan/LPS O-acetylase OafA/YrhL
MNAGRVTRSPSIPSLDGLRAISWFAVFVSHAFRPLDFIGRFGVTVFFFLSGYLITTLLRVEVEDTGSVDVRAFYIRRALRILPPFYAIMAFAILMARLVPGASMLTSGVVALACHYVNYWVIAHSWVGLPPGAAVYWSLAVEEHFYLVFPLLFILLQHLRSGRARAMALWAVCFVVLGWRGWLVLVDHADQLRTFLASDTRADSLLYGCALAQFGNPMLDGTRFSEVTWKWLLFPVAIVALVVTFPMNNHPALRETVRYSIQGLALVPVFVCGIRFPTWRPFTLLNTRPLQIVGALSYTLYLVHAVILETLDRLGLKLMSRAALGFVLSLVVAKIVQIGIERPSQRLRRVLLHNPALAHPSAANVG